MHLHMVCQRDVKMLIFVDKYKVVTFVLHLYDESMNLYRLRQWFRRGRHNYLYATGRLNADTEQIMDLSFEEFEGNTASANNSFIAFAYYRELDYGGYDGIVAVGSSTMYLGR